MMQPHETKNVFLSLLGEPEDTTDLATLPIAPISLRRVWNVFKQWMVMPVECVNEGFIFEAHMEPSRTVPEHHFYAILRRYYFLPFADDPDALYQLCFECYLLYPPSQTYKQLETWFQVEVTDDLGAAVQAFEQQVENLDQLWQLLGDVVPVEAYVFQ